MAERHERTRLVDALGLRESAEEAVIDTHLAHLGSAAATWPFAMVGQATACAVLALSALPTHPPILTGSTLAMGVLGVSALTILCLLMLPVGWNWPVHTRKRLVLLGGAVLAAALSSLLWATVRLPVGPLQLGAFASVAGAIGVSAIALHPVRAGTIGFATGLVLMLGVITGQSLASGIGVLFLAGLIVITCRLAARDVALARRLAADTNEGKVATKMIAEFEGHGTGWFWEADRTGRLTYLSAKVAAEIAPFGGTPVGRLLTDVFRMDSAAPGTERTLAFHIASRTSFSDYSVCAAGDAEGERWWSISGRPVVDEIGRFQGFIGSGSDLTEKRKSEAEITRLALFDGLTGLANRQRMKVSLDKTLAQTAGPYRATALLLLDLDRFKAVNDTLGHQAGDALLKVVAQRLQRGVGEAGLVGRLGGDEFQVVLPGEDKRETLSALAATLIASLSQPYSIGGQSVTIGCSIGIAITPDDGEDSETLVRNADLALYAAKADGRGVHRFYSREMLAGAQSRKQLEDDLRGAIVNGGFHLAYQAVVSTKDTRIVGYEALLRWDHPTRGAISPAEFIPVAEDCGLIEAIGEWALRTACAEAVRWPGRIRVAVNVSPIQFANVALPGLVTSALAGAGLAADRLELEITESVFLNDSAATDRMFKALKGIGVRLALDDFGTGYSSLGYLKTAPFDKIKIDQSFVRGATQPGNRNAAIIKAIVTLADTLGMETTAEGLEVQDEIALIRELGCSHIQGYVYAKPARGEEVVRQLAANGGFATATGYKVSRSPRTRMLRSARIAIGDTTGDVRIRDLSATGAMIDGIAIEGEANGIDVLIELIEDQMFPATLRWAKDGKAGMEFAEHLNLERLLETPGRQKRTG